MHARPAVAPLTHYDSSVTDAAREVVSAILAHLDYASSEGLYPYPQHDRMDYAAMRVHAYRGDTASDHLLMFEMLMFDREAHRILRFHGFCNHVFLYGSRGGNRGHEAWADQVFPPTIDSDPDGPSVSMTEAADESIASERDRTKLNPDARVVVIRGERVVVPHDRASYEAHGITPSDPIALRDLLRLLVATHRDALFSTDSERAEIAGGMTKLLTLDELHHLDLDECDAPSKTSAIRMLAEVLVTGDPQRYAPTEPSNTDWRQVRP